MSEANMLEQRVASIKEELQGNKAHVKKLKTELKKSESILEYLKTLG